MKYINRYSETYTFELMPNGNISWKGSFQYFRTSLNEDNVITFLDPTGGPAIVKGEDMKLVSKEFSKMIVDEMIIRTNEIDKSTWVEIVIEKKSE